MSIADPIEARVTIRSLSSVISGGIGASARRFTLKSKSPAQAHCVHHTAIMAEQQVNLTDLDLNQLQDVKKQLDAVSFGFVLVKGFTNEQELEHLTGSYQQLKQAQAKFRSCVSDISELTPSSKGRFSGLASWDELMR